MGPSQRMYHFRGAALDQKADEKELVERAAGDFFLRLPRQNVRGIFRS